MEKSEQKLLYRTDTVNLSFRDLVSIYKILEEFDNEIKETNGFSLEMGGYKITDISDIYNLPESKYYSMIISYLNLNTKTHIYLSVSSVSTHFSCTYDPDPKVQNPLLIRGAYEKIKLLLVQNNRRKKGFRKFFILNVWSYFIGLVLLLITSISQKNIFLYLGIGFLVYTIISYIIKPKKSIIFNQEENHQNSFFSKNKDKIILAIISTTIGFFLKFLYDLASNWISNLK